MRFFSLIYELRSLSVQRGRNALDTVETLNVGISLVLHGRPVKFVDHLLGGRIITEAVCGGFANSIGHIGGVPHEFCEVSHTS